MTYEDVQAIRFITLLSLVGKWAEDRNLIEGSKPKDQFHKLIQESAELSESLCKGKDATDDIGDILVVLIILAKQLGLDLVDCLDYAYNEIKDRKGVMKDGIFIKEEQQ